jgi:hypothetical protein
LILVALLNIAAEARKLTTFCYHQSSFSIKNKGVLLFVAEETAQVPVLQEAETRQLLSAVIYDVNPAKTGHVGSLH